MHRDSCQTKCMPPACKHCCTSSALQQLAGQRDAHNTCILVHYWLTAGPVPFMACKLANSHANGTNDDAWHRDAHAGSEQLALSASRSQLRHLPDVPAVFDTPMTTPAYFGAMSMWFTEKAAACNATETQ